MLAFNRKNSKLQFFSAEQYVELVDSGSVPGVTALRPAWYKLRELKDPDYSNVRVSCLSFQPVWSVTAFAVEEVSG